MAVTTNIASPNKNIQTNFSIIQNNDSYSEAKKAVDGSYWDALCEKMFYDLGVNTIISMNQFLVLATEPGTEFSSLIATPPSGNPNITATDSIGPPLTSSQWLATADANVLAGLIGGTSDWATIIGNIYSGAISQFSISNNPAGLNSVTFLHLASITQNTAGVLSDATSSVATGEIPVFSFPSLSGTFQIAAKLNVDNGIFSGKLSDAVSVIDTRVICLCGPPAVRFEVQHSVRNLPGVSPISPC